MTAPTGERLVSDYFARLEAAVLRLPPDRRADLLEGIAEHVAEARAAGELRDETAVRTLLDRLGEPDEIVAAAREDSAGGWGPPVWGAGARGAVPTQPGTGLETAAVLLMTLGSVVPLLGWLVGVALLWSSRRWRVSEKLLGTLVVPGGPGAALWLGGLPNGVESCTTTVAVRPDVVVEEPGTTGAPDATLREPTDTSTTVCESSSGLGPIADLPDWAYIAGLAFVVLAPIAVAVLLLRRARARAAAEPPVMRVPGSSAWTGLEIAAVVVLAVGGFVIPLVGSLVGLVLVWVSSRWTTLEKAVGTGLALLPLLVVGTVFLSAATGLSVWLSTVGVLGLFLGMFGPIIATVYLAVVLSRRPVG